MSSKKQYFTIMEYKNGIYQGDLLNQSIRQGLGVYLWDSGEFYFGEWKNDEIEGLGILYFPFGGYIAGLFSHNKLDGEGILEFPNKDIYNGEFKKGKLHGQCYKYFKDNNSWMLCEYNNGIFQKGKNKGKGPLPIDNIKNYFEKLKNIEANNRENNIEYTENNYHFKYIEFPDNGRYVGVTKNNLPNGLGMFYYNDGKSDQGFYQNGIFEGFGRLHFQNGDVYDGMMKQGVFNGYGTFYKKNMNKWIYGIFEDNKCMEIIEKGDEFPFLKMVNIKMDQHKSSHFFKDIDTKTNVFEIPIYHNASQPSTTKSNQNSNKKLFKPIEKTNFPRTSSSSTLNKENISVCSNIPTHKKIILTNEIATNTNSIMLKDQFTQFEYNKTNEIGVQTDFIDEKILIIDNNKDNSNNESQFSKLKSDVNNENSLINEEINKKMTKSDLENLFKSVKEMISKPVDLKIKPNIEENHVLNENSWSSSEPTSSLNKEIKERSQISENLIQKFDNLKKREENLNTRQSLLQSVDFSLSKSESVFSNLENNNFTNKLSNLVESKLLDSNYYNKDTLYLSSKNILNSNNGINITKSLDMIEKLLNSQINTKESKISSSNIMLSNIENNDNAFYSDNDFNDEIELFHSKIINSYNNTNIEKMMPYFRENSPMRDNINNNSIHEYINNSNQQYNDNINENNNKLNTEIILKYGNGIEKIDEKSEELNSSPHNKNSILKFGNNKSNEKKSLLNGNNNFDNIESQKEKIGKSKKRKIDNFNDKENEFIIKDEGMLFSNVFKKKLSPK